MNDNQLVLSHLLEAIYGTLRVLLRAEAAASAANLRKAIATQHSEWDALESEAQMLALQRGWDPVELLPIFPRFRSQGLYWLLHRQPTDSSLTEMLIRYYTSKSIHIRKLTHRCDLRDPQLDTLVQKILDCLTAGMMQLQKFL